MLSIRVPKRPKARTLLLATAATAVGLALIPTGGTYALWSDAETVSPGTITSGSMTLTINEPALNTAAWSNLLPGQSAAQVFTVTNTGTVAASLAGAVAVSGSSAIADHMTLRLTPVTNVIDCKPGLGGVAAALKSYAAAITSDLAANTPTLICAEVMLNVGAPQTVQGQAAPFAITLTATQK